MLVALTPVLAGEQPAGAADYTDFESRTLNFFDSNGQAQSCVVIDDAEFNNDDADHPTLTISWGRHSRRLLFWQRRVHHWGYVEGREWRGSKLH